MIGAGKHREKGCGMELQQCSDVQLAALVRAGQGEAFAELSARLELVSVPLVQGLSPDKPGRTENSV